MVKVGIIGCGKIAQVRHIPEYLDNPNAKLTGLYDLNLQRAKELAEKYDCKSYESVEEMLADPEIDAVSVCVANHVHSEITIAALKAGKHVLCEKPMATKLKDCQMMVDTAEQMSKKTYDRSESEICKSPCRSKKTHRAWRYRKRSYFQNNIRTWRSGNMECRCWSAKLVL